MNEELNLKSAAADVGVHPKTVRAWIDKGLLKGDQRGPKVVRIVRRDLEEFKKKYRDKLACV